MVSKGIDALVFVLAVARADAINYNCSALPPSMTSGASAGCHGAVWSNGKPSQAYCEGNGRSHDGRSHSWWSACCEWDGSVCKPKGTNDYDCTVVPPSMNGDEFPSGCAGAVYSDGKSSQSYCAGTQGKYPWWQACCTWVDDTCKSKDFISCAATTTTTSFFSCAAVGEKGWCGSADGIGKKQACVCKGKDLSFCEQHCKNDPKCQGFVDQFWRSQYCTMPMRGELDPDYCSSLDQSCYFNNHGIEVDEGIRCTSSGKGYKGCFIKNFTMTTTTTTSATLTITTTTPHGHTDWGFSLGHGLVSHSAHTTTTTTTVSSTLITHDCAVLPKSMSGDYPSGCPGAVWSNNGLPSQQYCEGDGGSYSWWSACCEWDSNVCKPRGTQRFDCTILPMSMNGAQYPRGCPGAMWSTGNASKSYCEGGACSEYLWWSACCQWDGNACQSKSARRLHVQDSTPGSLLFI